MLKAVVKYNIINKGRCTFIARLENIYYLGENLEYDGSNKHTIVIWNVLKWCNKCTTLDYFFFSHFFCIFYYIHTYKYVYLVNHLCQVSYHVRKNTTSSLHYSLSFRRYFTKWNQKVNLSIYWQLFAFDFCCVTIVNKGSDAWLMIRVFWPLDPRVVTYMQLMLKFVYLCSSLLGSTFHYQNGDHCSFVFSLAYALDSWCQ